MVRAGGLIALIVGGWLLALPAVATTNYIYPLDSWDVSTVHGEDIGGLFHMGVDAGFEFGSGRVVYAVADGIVREAQERTQFGLVVLIEHFPKNESANVSLYGHLDPTDVRVTEGQTVQAGDIIGVLGSEENNGGWTPHLHFGIHKQPYTGVWVYYGHVHDAETADEWFDPETYIPEHLVADAWAPTIEFDIVDGAIVGTTADITVAARDLGSQVRSIKYRVSADGGQQWTTVATSEDPPGEEVIQLPLYSYADGPLVIKAVARDHFDHKAVATVQVVKDPYRYTTPAFIAMKGGHSDAFVTVWSFGGTALQAFFPFRTQWTFGGDIASGDVLGLGSPQIITARGTPAIPAKIKVFDDAGTRLSSFQLSEFGSIRIASADTTGDGIDEIVVGSGKRDLATISVLSADGTVVWSAQPLGVDQRGGLNVTAGNLDADTAAEVVAITRSGPATEVFVFDDSGTVLKQFYPFRKKFTGGASAVIGDVTGDGQSEIIIASESGRAGTVKIVDLELQPVSAAFQPFGDDFTGALDVSVVQWDTTEDSVVEQELIVSQASTGQAWIKVYRLSAEPEVIVEKRVYEADFFDGARIEGYSSLNL